MNGPRSAMLSRISVACFCAGGASLAYAIAREWTAALLLGSLMVVGVACFLIDLFTDIYVMRRFDHHLSEAIEHDRRQKL